jgi:hypothetical protein
MYSSNIFKDSHESRPLSLGIGTGNPGVFQGYPYPYLKKPVPVPRGTGTGTGTGSAKTRGYTTRAWLHSRNRMRNLAIAVQMSIDTAVQHCEVSNQRGEHPSLHGSLIVGRLVGGCSSLCLCSHSCGVSALTWMLIVAAVVEPTWLGSVSIRKGRRERGACVVFVGRRPFALVVFFRSYTGVVCIRQFLCSFRVFRGCRGPKKPNLSVEVR